MKFIMHSRALGSWLPVLCLFVLLLFSGRLVAQIDRGEITGTVEDPSGAVIPNAKVLLTNDATNVTLATTSTGTGNYTFGNLLPGKYDIQVEAAGFQKYVAHDLYVHVQQVMGMDIHLSTGNVQQTVTVTAAAPLLESENAALGQTITNQSVADLPLVTRDWGSLAQLSAGVSTPPAGNPTPDSGTTASAYFSVNGINIWQNDFRLNGINDNIEVFGGNYTGTNAAIVPPPDAIQEFKVQNGDFNAEFGHSTGGVVNAAIKSGTNGLHGDVWEYVRNDKFNANYFFNRTCASGVCKPNAIPEYRQNIFGVTAGGPVIIPHVLHGRDKTFWFFDYQGQRYVQPVPATSTVPTAGMTSSKYTNLQDLIKYNSGSATDALGRKFPHGTVLDPATTRAIAAGATDPISGLTNTTTSTAYVRDPFYNCAASGCPTGNYLPGGPLAGITDFTAAAQSARLNVIPTARMDTNAVNLLNLYPTPTNSTALSNNFTWVPKQSQNNNTWDIRIDENINEKNILFGVFDRSLFTRNVPANLPGLAVGQGGARTDSLPAYAWAVGYTRIFTPTLTNEMHAGMVHSDKIQQSTYGNSLGIPAQFGIQGTQQVANNGGLGAINVGGLKGLGVGNYTPTLQYVWSIEGEDAVTKVYRNHTFKTGLQIDDLEGDISQPPQGRGNFNFNGQYTDVPNKNSGLTGMGDILVSPTKSLVTTSGGIDNVGGMSSFSGSNIAATDDHRWYWGAFFQDDWKVDPKLTLNLGVRWDYFTPYAETNGRQANFVANGGNGNTGTYYMSTKGCAVARSTAFNNLIAASNISLNCVPNLTLGHAQKTNFSPRVGFAYSIQPHLVIRGGFAMAYGALGNLGYGGTLGTNYPFVYVQNLPSADSQHSITLPNGQPATMEQAFTQYNFQDPTVNTATGLNLYGRQYNFQTPYTETENLTIQDQFTNHDSIQVGYVGTQGRHLDNLGYNNSNTQFLPVGQNAQNSGGIPYPNFARNATYETTNADSLYSSLQTTYEHQLSAGLYLLTNFTWSKCMTDQHTQASQYQGYRAEWLPGWGIKGDYGLCDTDATRLFHLAGTYELPFGHGRMFMGQANKAEDAVLGGWTFNFIYSYQSGQPTTVTCPTGTSADFGCYANTVSGQDLYAGPHNYAQWLNPSAFAQPPAATAVGQVDFSPLGGHPQQVRGPGYNNLDSSMLKDFHFTEAIFLQFRAEAFNTFNTPPFAQPGNLNQFTNVSGGFSSITSTKNSNGNNGARTLQLALKLFY